MDDFYVNAGLKGRTYHDRPGRPARSKGLKPPLGRGSYDKDTLMILYLQERDGPLFLEPVIHESPIRKVKALVEEGSTIYTDEWTPYQVLEALGYMHEAVNHSLGEYARGDVHVNHDESIVSLFKPWLAKHSGIDKKNLSLYTATFQTLYNISNLSNREKFWKIIRICISNKIPQ